MKKLFIILSVLLFLFLLYIWRCKVSTSNYFYKQLNYYKQLNNVYDITGNYIQIPKDKLNHPIVLVYPISQNENFNIQVTGGTIVAFFHIYNTLWFKEYKMSDVEKGNLTFLHVDTSKPISNLSVAAFFENSVKETLIGIFYRFFGYSVFNKWLGQLSHLWILVYWNTTWNIEITKNK